MHTDDGRVLKFEHGKPFGDFTVNLGPCIKVEVGPKPAVHYVWRSMLSSVSPKWGMYLKNPPFFAHFAGILQLPDDEPMVFHNVMLWAARRVEPHDTVRLPDASFDLVKMYIFARKHNVFELFRDIIKEFFALFAGVKYNPSQLYQVPRLRVVQYLFEHGGPIWGHHDELQDFFTELLAMRVPYEDLILLFRSGRISGRLKGHIMYKMPGNSLRQFQDFHRKDSDAPTELRLSDYLVQGRPTASHMIWKDDRLAKEHVYDSEGDLQEIREYDEKQNIVKRVDLNPDGGVPLP